MSKSVSKKLLSQTGLSQSWYKAKKHVLTHSTTTTKLMKIVDTTNPIVDALKLSIPAPIPSAMRYTVTSVRNRPRPLLASNSGLDDRLIAKNSVQPSIANSMIVMNGTISVKITCAQSRWDYNVVINSSRGTVRPLLAIVLVALQQAKARTDIIRTSEPVAGNDRRKPTNPKHFSATPRAPAVRTPAMAPAK